MAEPKTQLTGSSVDAFLDAIPKEQIRNDSRTVAGLMSRAASAGAEMWGASIVGFGRKKLTYANGRQAEWMVIGFAPRKQAITLYLGDFPGRQALLDTLGPHTCAGGCIHVKRVSDVHLPTLKKLIAAAAKHSARN